MKTEAIRWGGEPWRPNIKWHMSDAAISAGVVFAFRQATCTSGSKWSHRLHKARFEDGRFFHDSFFTHTLPTGHGRPRRIFKALLTPQQSLMNERDRVKKSLASAVVNVTPLKLGGDKKARQHCPPAEPRCCQACVAEGIWWALPNGHETDLGRNIKGCRRGRSANYLPSSVLALPLGQWQRFRVFHREGSIFRSPGTKNSARVDLSAQRMVVALTVAWFRPCQLSEGIFYEATMWPELLTTLSLKR